MSKEKKPQDYSTKIEEKKQANTQAEKLSDKLNTSKDNDDYHEIYPRDNRSKDEEEAKNAFRDYTNTRNVFAGIYPLLKQQDFVLIYDVVKTFTKLFFAINPINKTIKKEKKTLSNISCAFCEVETIHGEKTRCLIVGTSGQKVNQKGSSSTTHYKSEIQDFVNRLPELESKNNELSDLYSSFKKAAIAANIHVLMVDSFSENTLKNLPLGKDVSRLKGYSIFIMKAEGKWDRNFEARYKFCLPLVVETEGSMYFYWRNNEGAVEKIDLLDANYRRLYELMGNFYGENSENLKTNEAVASSKVPDEIYTTLESFGFSQEEGYWCGEIVVYPEIEKLIQQKSAKVLGTAHFHVELSPNDKKNNGVSLDVKNFKPQSSCSRCLQINEMKTFNYKHSNIQRKDYEDNINAPDTPYIIKTNLTPRRLTNLLPEQTSELASSMKNIWNLDRVKDVLAFSSHALGAFSNDPLKLSEAIKILCSENFLPINVSNACIDFIEKGQLTEEQKLLIGNLKNIAESSALNFWIKDKKLNGVEVYKFVEFLSSFIKADLYKKSLVDLSNKLPESFSVNEKENIIKLLKDFSNDSSKAIKADWLSPIISEIEKIPETYNQEEKKNTSKKGLKKNKQKLEKWKEETQNKGNAILDEIKNKIQKELQEQIVIPSEYIDYFSEEYVKSIRDLDALNQSLTEALQSQWIEKTIEENTENLLLLAGDFSIEDKEKVVGKYSLWNELQKESEALKNLAFIKIKEYSIKKLNNDDVLLVSLLKADIKKWGIKKINLAIKNSSGELALLFDLKFIDVTFVKKYNTELRKALEQRKLEISISDSPDLLKNIDSINSLIELFDAISIDPKNVEKEKISLINSIGKELNIAPLRNLKDLKNEKNKAFLNTLRNEIREKLDASLKRQIGIKIKALEDSNIKGLLGLINSRSLTLDAIKKIFNLQSDDLLINLLSRAPTYLGCGFRDIFDLSFLKQIAFEKKLEELKKTIEDGEAKTISSIQSQLIEICHNFYDISWNEILVLSKSESIKTILKELLIECFKKSWTVQSIEELTKFLKDNVKNINAKLEKSIFSALITEELFEQLKLYAQTVLAQKQKSMEKLEVIEKELIKKQADVVQPYASTGHFNKDSRAEIKIALADTSTEEEQKEALKKEIFTKAIKGKKSLRTVTSLGDLSTLKDLIGHNFKIGNAIDSGDCFFDALAQAINQIKSTHYDAKNLRDICFVARDKEITIHKNNQSEKKTARQLHEEDYSKSTSKKNKIPNYDLIKLTQSECNDTPCIFGRGHVEGILLCQELELDAILIKEIRFIEEENKNSFTLTEYIITKHGSIKTTDTNLSYENIPILIVEAPYKNEGLHFVPLLYETEEKKEKVIARESSEEDVEKIVTDEPSEEEVYDEDDERRYMQKALLDSFEESNKKDTVGVNSSSNETNRDKKTENAPLNSELTDEVSIKADTPEEEAEFKKLIAEQKAYSLENFEEEMEEKPAEEEPVASHDALKESYKNIFNTPSKENNETNTSPSNKQEEPKNEANTSPSNKQ